MFDRRMPHQSRRRQRIRETLAVPRPARLGPTRSPRIETLESRHLLAVIAPTTFFDEVDGDTSAIGALLASPGGTGISLREAVLAANNTPGSDLIQLSAGTYSLTIAGLFENESSTGDLDVTDDLVIRGEVGNTTIDAELLGDRVIDLPDYAASLSLLGVTIRGGSTSPTVASGMTLEARGAALRTTFQTTVTIDQASFIDNRAESIFGASFEISAGGAISSSGTLAITRTTFTDNYANNDGGAIHVGGSSGSTTIGESFFSGNSAPGGGAVQTNHDTWIDASTFVNNSTLWDFGDGGGSGSGGAISVQNGTLTLTNSTLSGNVSGSGGAIVVFATANISDSTIVHNEGTRGGGINNGPTVGTTTTVRNSIVALNSAQFNGADVYGDFVSEGFNFLGSTADSTGFGVAGDVIGGDPMLAGLADNGGATLTHALLAGSPAIDAANVANASDRDQRGFVRPIGSGPDIGAFERFDGTNQSPNATDDTATVTEDTADTISVLANDSDPDGNPLRVVIDTQPILGSASVNADGTIEYLPSADQSGDDSLVYRIDDGFGGTDFATLSITIQAVNDPPDAVDDTAEAVDSIAKDIAVLTNDFDVEGKVISVDSFQQPASGTVTDNGDATLRYLSDPGFVGVDTFTYTISDGTSASLPATVRVHVTGPPVAGDDFYAVEAAGALRIFAPGQNGIEIVSDLNEWVGQGKTYSYDDSDGLYRTFQVNNYPVNSFAYVDFDHSGAEDDWNFIFSAPDGADLQVGTYLNAIRHPFNTTTGGMDITATGRGCGSLEGNFTVERIDRRFDGLPARFEASFYQTCVRGDAKPWPAINGTVSFADNSRHTASVLDNDIDPDGDPLQAILLTEPANGSLSLSADGSVVYVPDNGFTGEDTFTYFAVDPLGLQSEPATVTIDVKLVNDNPVVNAITPLDPLLINAQTVQYEVEFSEPVNLDPQEFQLAMTGVSGASITDVSHSGDRAHWIVTIDTGAGDGTIQLRLIDTDRIGDLADNRLGGAGSGNGDFLTAATYTLDRTPLRNLVGTVFVDANRNGMNDAGETVAPGQTVFLDTNTNGMPDTGETTVTTNASGQFIFADLPPALYQVGVVEQSGWFITAASLGSVDVVFEAPSTSIDLGFEENLTEIAGVVFNDLNSDGSRQVGEDGLAGWIAFIDENGNGVLDGGETSVTTVADDLETLTVDESGTFTFTDLPLGTHTVVIQQDPFFVATSPVNVSAVLAASTDVVDVEFAVHNTRAGDISGVQFVDTNENGVFDNGEQPLAGVTVYVDLNDNEWPDAGEPQATSASDGTYVISGTPVGTYSVRTFSPLHYRSTAAADERLFAIEQRADGASDSGFYLRLLELDRADGSILQQHDTTIEISATVGLTYDGHRLLVTNFHDGTLVELTTDAQIIDETPFRIATGASRGLIGPVVVHGQAYVLESITSSTHLLYRYDVDSNTLDFVKPISYPVEGYPLGVSAPRPDFAASVSPDGNAIVASTRDARLVDIEVTTGRMTSEFVLGGPSREWATASVGGEFFVAYNDTVGVRVYDAAQSLQRTLTGLPTLYGLGGGNFRDSGQQITTVEGLPTANVHHGHLSTLSTLSGTITVDANGDGIVDVGEVGHANVTVYLDQNRNRMFDAGEPTTQSDASGDYRFTDVVPGEYFVRIDADPGRSVRAQTDDETRLFVLDGNTTASMIEEIDPLDGKTLNQFAAPGANTSTAGMALDGDSLYVAKSGGFFVLDANSGAEKGYLTLPPGSYDGVAAIGGKAYVQQLNNDTIHVIDPAALAIVDSFQILDSNQQPIDLNGALGENVDRTKLIVHTPGQGALIVDPLDQSIAGKLVVGRARGGTASGALGEIFAASGSANNLTVVGELIEPITGLPPTRFIRAIGAGFGVDGIGADAFAATQHRVLAAPNLNVSGLDFGDFLPASNIEGVLWDDANGNGSLDSGEQRLAGRTVFVDSNDNGILDPDEPMTTTSDDDTVTTDIDETGSYRLTDVGPGPRSVMQVLPAGWSQTFPGATNFDVQLDLLTGFSVGENDGNNFPKFDSALSHEGRFTAFTTDQSLLPADTNSNVDVYVRDRELGTVELVSQNSDGIGGNRVSVNPSISEDGRYVAFQSFATNLVPDDLNGTYDIFLRDREAGTTTLISAVELTLAGTSSSAESFSYNPDISGDGRFVIFWSDADNLVVGDTERRFDLFLRDLSAGTTERINLTPDGSEADGGNTHHGEITHDGRFVVYRSWANNLVPGDTNGESDVFVVDLQKDFAERAAERVSVSTTGVQGDGDSIDGSISNDGRFVVFSSDSTNLGGLSGVTGSQIYLRDRQTGQTELISGASDGSPPTGEAYRPSISADGRWIVFHSTADNLVVGDSNAKRDVFLFDMASRQTILLSHNGAGTSGNDDSEWARISRDGTTITFQSAATDLVATAPTEGGLYSVSLQTLPWMTVPHRVTLAPGESIGSVDFGSELNVHVPITAPTTVDQDAPLQIDFGAASVDPSVVVDRWIVHWGDGRSDTFNEQPISLLHRYVNAGTHSIRVEAVTDVGTIDFAASHSVDVIPVAPASMNRTDQGFLAQVFLDQTMTGNGTSNFIDSTIHVDFGSDSYAPAANVVDDFAVRWSGVVTPEHTADFTFITETGSDDGVRVYVNNVAIIDTWGTPTGDPRSATVSLTRGVPIDLRVEWALGTGRSKIGLWWESPVSLRELIRPELVTPTGQPTDRTLGFLEEVWGDVAGSSLDDLVHDPNYAANQPTLGSHRNQATLKWGPSVGTGVTGDNGRRLRTIVRAPETGWYTFAVAGSGQTELRLLRSINANVRELIASSAAATGVEDYDDFATQTSSPVHLTAGREYGIEVLQKNDGPLTDDHVSVAWTKPSDLPGTLTGIPQESIRPVLPKVTVQTESSEANEWQVLNNREIVFAFRRDDDLGRDIEVTYTIGGTAQNGIDYPQIGQSIVIPAGQRTARLRITPTQDVSIEGPETITLRLTDNSFNDASWRGDESERTATATIVGEYSTINGGSVPAGGTDLLPANAIRLANISFTAQAPNTTDPTIYANAPIDDVAVPFDEILTADVGTSLQPWHARAAWELTAGINQGDTLLYSVWARSANPDGSTAIAAVRVTEVSSTLGQAREFGVGPEWRQYTYAITANRTIAAGDARFDVRFGRAETDAIEIADARLINYGLLFDQATLARAISANALINASTQPANFGADSLFNSFSVNDSSLPFTSAMRIDVNSYVNPEDVRQHWIVDTPVTQGDKLFARFYARSRNSDGSPVTLSARFERPTSPHTGVEETFVAGSEWQEFLFAFEATEDRDSSQFQLRFGYGDPILDVGGVVLFNHGQDYDSSLLPRKIHSYQGRDADAPWRQAAQSTAKTQRDDAVAITILDPDGNPAEGVSLQLVPLREDYQIGSVINEDWVVGSSSLTPDGQRYRSIVSQLFTHVTDEKSQQWNHWIDDPLPATQLLAWAIANGLAVHGQPILSGKLDGDPTPASVRTTYEDKLTNEGTVAAEAYLESAITDYLAVSASAILDGDLGAANVEVAQWDVLRHPLQETAIWDITGEDFLFASIAAARAAANPASQFFVSEDHILSRESGAEDLLEQWITGSLAAEVPIDGIAFQSHFLSDQLPSISSILDDLRRFEETGLVLQVGEFDVDAKFLDHQSQADFTRDFLLAVESNAAVNATSLAGFWNGSHPRAADDAALFGSDWSVKPNGQVLIDSLRRGGPVLETSSDGSVLATVPRGSYQAHVVAIDGTSFTTTVTVDAGGTFAEIVVPATPTDIEVSDSTINENIDTTAADVLFANLSAVDPTPGDAHTFTLTPGDGDGDNTRFKIIGNQLMVKQGETLDAESQTTYSVRVRVTDSTGRWMEEPLSLGVRDLVEISPGDVSINGGDNQRSRVESLNITFDNEVDIAADAFEVNKRGAQGGAVIVAFTTSVDLQGRTVANLTFSGAYVENGSLMDGTYDLQIDGTKVTSVDDGAGMDANRDGIVGDDYFMGDDAADAFYRLFGDSDGNRAVNLVDFAAFRGAFGTAFGNPNFRHEFDAFQDNNINLVDFAAFRSRFGTAMPHQ